jgi:translation initiation factor 1 (eIF-1/SUI1)
MNETIVNIQAQFRSKDRQIITVVTGIPDIFDLRKILREWKKMFNCSGITTENIIKLSNNHVEKVRDFIINERICAAENIKCHF